MNAVWHLYLLECQRGDRRVYYAGITNHLERRYAQHCSGTGARFTRAHKPLGIMATRAYPNRSAASKAEAALKKLPRAKKLAFFAA